MSSSDRRRPGALIDRLIVLGVLALIGIAVYALLDDRPSVTTTDHDSAPPPITIAAPTTTAPATSTTTTSPTTTPTTTTTSTVVPTTAAATVEVVEAVCESLRSDGLETRRVVVGALAGAFEAAGGDGDGRNGVDAECGDELDRFDAAVAIRDRMQAIDIAEEDGLLAMSLDGFSCAATSFTVTVSNDSSTPLGLHANFVMYRNDDREDAIQSSHTPIVIWSLEPGESEVVTGRFTRAPQERVACGFDAQIFDADASSAGAPIGDTPDVAELTGDDPSVWFPAFFEFAREARASGDIDRVGSIADVRSMSYDETAFAISERLVPPDSELLEVCERGRSQPDPGHIGFVYLERLEDGRTRLLHALFRRGIDGQWRSLSTPRYFESLIADDCLGVDPE